MKAGASKKKDTRQGTTLLEEARGLGILLALEPRIMFDGAALLTGAEVVQDATAQDQTVIPGMDGETHTDSNTNDSSDNDALWFSGLSLTAPSDRKEIVFIDTRVEDYQTLMEGIDPNADVILLDSTRDGVEQITEALNGRSDIDAIHLIAEGTAAELHLGSTFLTQESISGQYADLFTQIGQSLSADADLLIYGCNFGQGEAGQDAMETLAELTGADIAASTDRTGHINEYADWELEVATGKIETSIVIGEATQTAWEGVLATYTVTTTTDGGAGSLRQAIINANANSGTDTITFVGGGTYTLTLTGTGENSAVTGDLDITDDLILIGNGVGNTIIDGAGIDRIFDVRSGATVNISEMTIQGGNYSGGGGINVSSGTDLTLSDVIVSGNTTVDDGGGIYNAGTLTLLDTAISGNSATWGGGIYNIAAMTLERVTIDGNMSTNNGAGIYNFGGTSVSLTNVTISGNTSGGNGGGIFTNQPINITNSTIASNLGGGGIHAVGSGDALLKNTILDNNVGGNAPGAPLTSLGNNIDSDGTALLGDPLDGMDPLLGALADNGGPTLTHALLGGSPAIDAGTAIGAPTVDQRGAPRDATPDIGAYESLAIATTAEFTVNDPNVENEETAGLIRGAERAVAIAPNGDYVVVWTHTTDNDKIFGKVLDQDGNEKVAQFQVNVVNGASNNAGVAMDDSGNFVVTWTKGNDIYMRRFQADGTAVDLADVLVNTTTPNLQVNPSVAMNSAGDFVIAWESSGGGNEGIFVRQGSFAGGLIGGEITVDTLAASQDPSVDINDDGKFVVVWQKGNEPYAQRFAADGTPRGSAIDIDPILSLTLEQHAVVAIQSSGDFVVAYRTEFTGLEGVYMWRYRDDGTSYGLGTKVSSGTSHVAPSIGMDSFGNYTIVYEGDGDGSGKGVFGRSYDSNGVAQGAQFQVNQTTLNAQDRASVAMLDPNNFVVVWTGSDGAQTDVFARQFGSAVNTPPTVDLDANNSSGATGNDYQFTFTEGDAATAIADTDTDLVDADSTTFASVTLAATGLLDGNAETLVLDGDTFALATAVAGQDTTGGNYRVVIATGAGTATLTITKQGGGTFTEIETETLIEAIQYQHTDTSAPTDGDRLIDVIVKDGALDSVAARTTINVDPVNDAPVVGAPGSALAATEQTNLSIEGTGFTVSDGDAASGTLTTTLTVGEGSLTVVVGDSGVTISSGNGMGTVVLTGTVTQMDTLLTGTSTGTITYLNSSNTPAASTTLTVTVNDQGNTGTDPGLTGDGTSEEGTNNVTINVTAINDQPSFTGLDNTPTFIEGGSAVVLDNNATIADPELDAANNYNGATLTLVRNGGANGNDVFNGSGTLNPLVESGSLVVGGTTIGTVTTNSAGTLVLTFNGNATTALVNSALQQITYANTNGTPPATVQVDFTIDDGNAGSQGSGPALNDTGSITVTINAANTAPTLDLDGDNNSGATGNDYQFTFTESDGPTAIADSDTDLVDLDSTTFASVKLAVSGLLDGNAEVLVLDGDTFALGTAVAGQDTTGGNYRVVIGTGAGTATLTITKQGGGLFTEGETETLITAIQYQHTDPSAPSDGDRLIDVLVNDGTDDSAAARTTINVNPVNAPPVNTVPATATVAEDTALAMTGANLITVTDVDGNLASTQLTVTNGTVTVTLSGAATISAGANGTSTLTLSGTETDINATLASLLYQGTLNYTGPDTLTTLSTDSAGVPLSDSDVTAITVTAVNVPPVAMPDGFTVLEGSTNTLNLAGNDTDADNGLDLASITIISGPTNGTIDSINMNGTVDYTHDGSETLADSFTYTIDDLAGATSNTVTVSLTVTPQNDAPIITSNGGGASAAITVIEGNTAVTDVNANDAEGGPLTFSLIGGVDAALFSIDPTTGVLTFNTVPDSEAPGDVGGDNVYDVVVQVSDGTTVDTQAIAVTVSQAPPVIVPLPPPVPAPDPVPPPTDGDGDDGDSEDETSEGGVPVVANSPGNLPGGGQGSTGKDSRDSGTGKNFGANNLGAMEQRTEDARLGNAVDEILDLLRKPFDPTTIKGEIQALLTRWGFLENLDRVRDAFQDVTATEQTYLASSVAASTGLSIGYVFWLLRSGVLLTALLSSLPAWQFVNPLLVLDRPEKKKRKKGQEDPEDDSVESMFEKHTVPAETSETKPGSKAKEHESRWFRRTSL